MTSEESRQKVAELQPRLDGINEELDRLCKEHGWAKFEILIDGMKVFGGALPSFPKDSKEFVQALDAVIYECKHGGMMGAFGNNEEPKLSVRPSQNQPTES